jgi:hypothetical protein
MAFSRGVLQQQGETEDGTMTQVSGNSQEEPPRLCISHLFFCFSDLISLFLGVDVLSITNHTSAAASSPPGPGHPG